LLKHFYNLTPLQRKCLKAFDLVDPPENVEPCNIILTIMGDRLTVGQLGISGGKKIKKKKEKKSLG
jgi:hypothetical protein